VLVRQRREVTECTAVKSPPDAEDLPSQLGSFSSAKKRSNQVHDAIKDPHELGVPIAGQEPTPQPGPPGRSTGYGLRYTSDSAHTVEGRKCATT
jgi:hypothetical protein